VYFTKINDRKYFLNPDQIKLGKVDVVEVLLDGDASVLPFPDFLGDAVAVSIGTVVCVL
jgi:hypothetical protein